MSILRGRGVVDELVAGRADSADHEEALAGYPANLAVVGVEIDVAADRSLEIGPEIADMTGWLGLLAPNIEDSCCAVLFHTKENIPMDFLSALLGAIVGAIATIVAALISRSSANEKKRFPEDIMQTARSLSTLQVERLKALRKHATGRRIASLSDEDQIRLAVYRSMAVEKLVNVIDDDTGGATITLTDRGWVVAAALDSME